ncbi:MULTISPECIES: ROK family protein [Micromonospora]|uniref:ROK family protein n=2 Tax=Micromonospora zamorensis TaxID=709883 RepID=A0ABZ1P796_9ACTN|nr:MULTISPECIES: ROK family protein [Micromonospora]TQJ21262.1 glucokinase [Micromonospora sp. A202]MBQ0978273.1 ROK family protein [Micromonospora sp. M61]WSK47382.1 ROK family protein [Micromonospora zamorensis]WTE89905.1 ROK family protein [Micromonospora zamorensis]WTI18732.1 ROK family protein [Micromonospora zamorensis]
MSKVRKPPVVDEAVAALDIGGTKTAAALVTRQGEVVHRATAPTPGRAGATAILDTAADLVDRLRARATGTRVRAVGVGSAGVIDHRTGLVLSATDALAGWAGTDLRRRLRELLDLPVAVINDVHAHALGETRHGVAAGHQTTLFLAVGTGIGASFVVDGTVLAGAHSAAGHAGHQPSPYAGQLPCTCGGQGHLEAIASGPGLAQEYARRTGQPVDDLRSVAARAADGDATAREVVLLGGAAVGSAVGGLVNMLDPAAVVIGGGVAGLGDLWWQALRDAVRRETLPSLVDVPVLASTLGSDAPLLGAASLAWEGTE